MTHVTFDAMSPVRDAVDATVYVDKPAHLKIRTWRALERLAKSTRQRWNCPCPFCKAFVTEHPFAYAEIRSTVADMARPLTIADIQPGGRLTNLAPLLSEPAGQLRRDVWQSRMGHNHWFLTRICRDLSRAAAANELDDHVESVVAAYEVHSRGSNLGEAVRIAATVSRGE